MKNYKYAINTFYDKYLYSTDISDILDLYLTDEANNDSDLKKVQTVLACFHGELNYYFECLNARIKGNRYFAAQPSRELINLVNDVFEFGSALKNSPYNFKTTKQCYALLKTAQGFLQESGGSEIPPDTQPLLLPKYSPIFDLNYIKEMSKEKNPTVELIRIISKVSTNDTEYSKMSTDEKLEKLNMCIEYLLKTNGKYIHLDYKLIFGDFVNEKDIVLYRNTTNCFRHGSEDAIKSRAILDNDYKIFLIEYGMLVVQSLLSYLKKD